MLKELFIDCQFFQTPVWDRGMGKYVLALLAAAAPDFKGVNVSLIFTKNLPKDDQMLSEVKKALPHGRLLDLDLKTTLKMSYKKAAAHNKAELQEQLGIIDASSTVFFIPCLFQEPTASVYPDNCRHAMIYYDAIPFLYYHAYKGAINYDNYLQRYASLLESDTILTISETVKDDLAVYLGIEDKRRKIISIDGAAIEGSNKIQKPNDLIPEPYILLTTSDDVRKNNKTAIMALEQLRKISKKDYKMVITSSFREAHKEELEKLSKNLIFTGNVPVEELNWLYNNAAAILCASEYEGLGLPILEAARFNKPIACSNIAVFREISNRAFYFFDPLSIEDITLQLREAIGKTDWQEKLELYSAINNKYTWDRSAKLLIGELNSLAKHQTSNEPAAPKPKIAILCPTPSGYSAVGRVVQEIHDGIAAHFEIDYYFENRKKKLVSIRPNYLPYVTNAYDVAEFNARKYSEYDMVIYHIGNSEYHFITICNSLHLPGIAIIHDTRLTECFGEMAKQGFISPERLDAETMLNELADTGNSAYIGSIINNQIGAIVHSDYAHEAIDEVNIKKALLQRSALAVPAPSQQPHIVKSRKVQIGLAGVLSGKRKGIDIIKDLARDPEISANVAFYVFGFNLMDPQDIKELKSYDNITLTTDLSDLAYQTQLANLDIMINYRSEYKGEASSSVLEAMRYGCTVIVNGTKGWFAELPDEAVAKVGGPAELESILRELILSPEKRDKIGNAARAYVPRNHSPIVYGNDLIDLYNKVANSESPNSQKSRIIKGSESLAEVVSKMGGLDE